MAIYLQSSGDSVKTASQEPVKASTGKSLADMFKPAAGSWTCSVCLVNNSAEMSKCAACETPNPNAPKVEEAAAPQTPFGKLYAWEVLYLKSNILICSSGSERNILSYIFCIWR